MPVATPSRNGWEWYSTASRLQPTQQVIQSSHLTSVHKELKMDQQTDYLAIQIILILKMKPQKIKVGPLLECVMYMTDPLLLFSKISFHLIYNFIHLKFQIQTQMPWDIQETNFIQGMLNFLYQIIYKEILLEQQYSLHQVGGHIVIKIL